MYLLDSNIPLEVLLKQEKANEVKEFLNSFEHKFFTFNGFLIILNWYTFNKER